MNKLKAMIQKMKRYKKFVMPIISLALIFSLYQNCGSTSVPSVGSGGQPLNNSTGGGGGSTVSTHAMATIQSGGTTVAHVIGFETNAVYVYIPSVDRYIGYVDLTNGSYFGTWNILYWSGAGCTGVPFGEGNFMGEVGKTVMFDPLNSSYFLVSSIYPIGTVLSFQSSSSGGVCSATAGTQTVQYLNYINATVQLTPTTQPYNFSAIAPLHVTFP